MSQACKTDVELVHGVSRPAATNADSTVRVKESTLPRILLASRSPRRREFLAQAGIEHEAEHPGVEDSILESGNVSPTQWVMSLAYLKARAGVSQLGGRHRLVVGADTTCVVDGKLVGTPRNEQEAREMIRSFVGRSHEVVTGVAIVDSVSGERELFSDSATVVFGPLSDEMIEEYIASGTWAGKAGAYNLADRIAAGWPIIPSGEETTIMGLPMKKLQARLAAWKQRHA